MNQIGAPFPPASHKTIVAPCVGGPIAGKLLRTPVDVRTVMVPKDEPDGIIFIVYHLKTMENDGTRFWSCEA